MNADIQPSSHQMEIEQNKHTCASVCDRLPTLSANHPWLYDDNLKIQVYDADHIFYTTQDPPSQYRFQLPSSLGRQQQQQQRIRGCFHGWVILSNHPHNGRWSLWNPLTSNIIRLPPLSLENRDDFLPQHCCLSAPPGEPGSIFMLTAKNHSIVFCRLDSCDKKLKWAGMSYAKQMRRIVGDYRGVLYNLTCCNGKVYGLHVGGTAYFVIHIDIVVKGTKIVISLHQYLEIPREVQVCSTSIPFLIGCCTELFYIMVGLNRLDGVDEVGGVYVFKLDMTNMTWEEMVDLKDAAFFLDLSQASSMFYSPRIASGLGGYVHIFQTSGKVIYSCDFKNKTVTVLSSRPTSRTSKHRSSPRGEIKSLNKENTDQSHLLDMPLDVVETIMERCDGVEYLNFRATCKQCHLAAPMIRWRKGGELHSPLLVVLHKDRGEISFTDPMSGDEYFIKTPPELIGDVVIHCSKFGWLLIRKIGGPLMFYNPFTSDIRELPELPELPLMPYLESFCFSAPPTSSDCMVAGLSSPLLFEWHFCTILPQEPVWRSFRLNSRDDDICSFRFPTLYTGLNQYALCNDGRIDFINTDNEDYTWRESPISSDKSGKQSFLTKCDQQLLLVIVSEFGETVEVFRLNDSTGWEKTESLERHTIYISRKTCLCIEAKTPIMANKIYFPRISENKKVFFYSLETRRYHTSDIDESFGDFMGTKHHFDPHVWIEPSWS